MPVSSAVTTNDVGIAWDGDRTSNGFNSFNRCLNSSRSSNSEGQMDRGKA